MMNTRKIKYLKLKMKMKTFNNSWPNKQVMDKTSRTMKDQLDLCLLYFQILKVLLQKEAPQKFRTRWKNKNLTLFTKNPYFDISQVFIKTNLFNSQITKKCIKTNSYKKLKNSLIIISQNCLNS